MRLHVFHESRYFYSTPVYGIVMEARLRPCSDDFQFCQRYRLTVNPKTAIQEYTTFSDLTVHYWSLLKASDVTITAESIVDTHERPLIAVEAPPAEFDQVELYPYLLDTPLTDTSPTIHEFADQFAALAREDWYQTAFAIREAIYSNMEFEVGVTEVQTTAAEALDSRRGVCQDFTHLMIACLRALGIPARYVSGYLNPVTVPDLSATTSGNGFRGMSQSLPGMSQQQTMDQQGMTQSQNGSPASENADPPKRGTGTSHAWCEVFLGPTIGWRGFDPTNNLLIDQQYVRIGAGRDYSDVTPMKGVHKGPAEEELQVTVKVKAVS